MKYIISEAILKINTSTTWNKENSIKASSQKIKFNYA